MKAALAMLGGTVLVLSLARPLEPYSWGHRLTEACSWLPRPAAQLVGGEALDTPAIAAELACWRRHGAKAFSGDVRVLLAKFPTPAELAEWNGETP